MRGFLLFFIFMYYSWLSTATVYAVEKIENIQVTEQAEPLPHKNNDLQIEQRLNKIFQVTGWYPELHIEVKEGVAFLKGRIDVSDKKDWALQLVNKTDGVIAVVDQLDNTLPANEMLEPAAQETAQLFRRIAKQIPYIASGIIVFLIFLLLAYLSRRIAYSSMQARRNNVLLTKTVANMVGFSFLLLGMYLALKTSGLSALAISLLGGTGMLGIGVGLALKSTFENYASSIMITLRELLKIGEIVSVDGFEGVVQSVTTRGTTLMDYEGNHIIIPNSQVFNSVIKNFTRNPRMRADFIVGIGYHDSIAQSREIILQTITTCHEEVFTDPAPFVVVDALASSSVNLKVFFWFDAVKSSKVKLRSAIIESVKKTLTEAGITIPGDGREVTFLTPLQIERVTKERLANEEVAREKIGNESEAREKVQQNERNLRSHPSEVVGPDIDTSSELKDIHNQVSQNPPAEKGDNIV